MNHNINFETYLKAISNYMVIFTALIQKNNKNCFLQKVRLLR
jgi:hypothetical protein